SRAIPQRRWEAWWWRRRRAPVDRSVEASGMLANCPPAAAEPKRGDSSKKLCAEGTPSGTPNDVPGARVARPERTSSTQTEGAAARIAGRDAVLSTPTRQMAGPRRVRLVQLCKAK